MLEPQVRQDHGLIDVNGDLLGAALRRDVLRACELGATAVAPKLDQIVCHQRHRPARTLLPRRVGSRVDHDLTHNPPTRVMRIAPRNQKASERLRHPERLRLGAMTVQMPQRGAHTAAVIHGSGDLARAHARTAWFTVDPATYPSVRRPVRV